MNRIITLLILLTTYIFSNINVAVSILPEKAFVKAIGGEKVHIALMVLPGNSPHTYEPKPSQMKEITQADLYFAIGVEFEKVWLPKFKNLNATMQIIDLTQGIQKLFMHPHQAQRGGQAAKNEVQDPHIWTSPDNVKIIAKHIYSALVQQDPSHQAYYQKNLEIFEHQIDKTDRKIKQILSQTPKGTKFMVFHPSWGYFAHAYSLIQLAVEVEGKSPKPRELIDLIKEARREKIQAIFTQPEFSDAAARVMAKELKIKVIKVSPLNEAWSDNLLNIAHAIAGNGYQ